MVICDENACYLNRNMTTHNEGDLFYTVDDAALGFGLMYNKKSINEAREYGANIYSESTSNKSLVRNNYYTNYNSTEIRGKL